MFLINLPADHSERGRGGGVLERGAQEILTREGELNGEITVHKHKVD